MFTGLVEGRGTIAQLTPAGTSLALAVRPPESMVGPPTDAVRVGDSVAINGCCLTVTRATGDAWEFQAGAETLSRTNLGRLQVGDVVNLERALPVSGRLGGHFVQGHIDSVGRVDAIQRDGEWITMWFRVPPRLTRQIVEKGSVAVDGVSLTLVSVELERFSVALVPHTLEVTTLGVRRTGDEVNIETDVLGKYVEKMLRL
jgi:riboflavin synthase